MIQMPELEKSLYTIKEAAKLLTVSDDTVRKMIEAKELSAVKVHGTWRVHRESLERYLKP